MEKPFYGLDFGTSNSVMAFARHDTAEILPVDEYSSDPTVMQSVLYFKKDGSYEVGQKAIEQYLFDNAHRRPVQWREIDTKEEKRVEIVGVNGIVYYTTTFKYRVDINKPGQFVQAIKTTLREGALDNAVIFDKTYPLESLVASLLVHMKKQADIQVGEDVRKVVIGRPVHYLNANEDDSHVEVRMRKAAEMAGFEEVCFMAEPIAAALSYLQTSSEAKKVLVFDFGGGTLDFSLVYRDRGKPARVIATGGLPIGGNTFNEEIMIKILAPYFGAEELWGKQRLPMPAFLKQSLRRWYELDHLQTTEIRNFLNEAERSVDNPQYIINLRDLINYDLGYHLFRRIEEAKKELSISSSTRLVYERERLRVDIVITREQFENLLAPYVEIIEHTLNDLLTKAGVETKDIDHVVATGGSSLIPLIRDRLHQLFGEEKVVYHDIFTGVGAGLAMADTVSTSSK